MLGPTSITRSRAIKRSFGDAESEMHEEDGVDFHGTSMKRRCVSGPSGLLSLQTSAALFPATLSFPSTVPPQPTMSLSTTPAGPSPVAPLSSALVPATAFMVADLVSSDNNVVSCAPASIATFQCSSEDASMSSSGAHVGPQDSVHLPSDQSMQRPAAQNSENTASVNQSSCGAPPPQMSPPTQVSSHLPHVAAICNTRYDMVCPMTQYWMF
eukprot:TRINITY_DN14225_c0_g1_i1.p1 TRINITY_DN14225_c0_g1~~TRINITY_DN14225_c0_g1_i1.p1  ORF type:complete len:212 (+),score=4.25 TRINITY_DN14225_c0_g1_i1:111-746(+)